MPRSPRWVRQNRGSGRTAAGTTEAPATVPTEREGAHRSVGALAGVGGG
ncbi:hypothetical protein [Brachybacterium sacelli]